MSSLSPLSHLSLYATGTRSGGFPANAPSDLPSNSVAPSVRESRSTGNAKGEVPSETGSQAVRATAMAPAEPSGQDRAVAAQAMQVMLQAQSELASEQTSSEPQEQSSDSDSEDTSVSSRGGVSEDASRTGQQARTTYQNIAGFGPGATSSEVGLLPVSA